MKTRIPRKLKKKQKTILTFAKKFRRCELKHFSKLINKLELCS